MNEEIYNKMKLHSIEIGESIATITNFIFDMYLKEMKNSKLIEIKQIDYKHI